MTWNGVSFAMSESGMQGIARHGSECLADPAREFAVNEARRAGGAEPSGPSDATATISN